MRRLLVVLCLFAVPASAQVNRNSPEAVTAAVTNAAGSIAGSNPCANPTATILGLSGATAGTVAVQLIALSGTTKIYLCSVTITAVSGTTPTFSLRYGTGTACATGPVAMIGPFATATIGQVFAFVSPAAVTPAGQELCYLGTGTLPIQNYNITYIQQ